MRELAALVMRSHFHAMLVVGIFGALSLIFLPAGFLSAGALGLVALRRGLASALVVAAGALPLVAVGWFFVRLRPGLGFPIVTILWVPLLAGAFALRRLQSQGAALLSVALLCALGAIAMHLVTGDVVAFWQGWLSRAVAGVPGATVRGFETDGTLRLMNGLAALFLGLAVMLSLLLARWMQSILYYPGGFGVEFRALGLPRIVSLIVVAALLAAGGVSQVMLVDLLMVAIMMYFFVGLAVIHGIVNKRNLPWVWAAPPYLAVIFMPQYAMVGLAFLGVADAFIRFRER
ncbi:MAG: uncharacterized protein H6R26_1055 [Proteobacteria bacterium]|nr:uncharacterized protein [Pseudomonadota bacterium]